MTTDSDDSLEQRRPARVSSLVWIAWHFVCLTALQLLVMRRASIILGEDYGAFAHLYALASFGLALTLIGLHGTLMRFLAILTASGARDTALRVLLRCAGLRLMLLLVAVAGLWCYLRVGLTSISAELAAEVCLFFVFQGMLLLQHAALQGFGRYGWLAAGSTCLFLGLVVPASDLPSVFRMLSVGYGCSFVANMVWITAHLRCVKQSKTAGDEDVGLLQLTKFSLVLSLAALFTLASDNSAILLLKDAYPEAVYSYLALGFNVAMYPARINAFSEAFILPQISASLHVDGLHRARARFLEWVRVLHLAGPLILLPLVLLIDPFLRAFFVPELSAAGFYASILIIGNVARMMLPASMSVIVGGGRPGLMAGAGALKLAIDLAIIFSLQAYSPKLLVTGLVVSWVLYINLLYMLARRQLAIRIEPDWLIVLIAGVGIGIVWAQLQMVVFIPAWILIGAYAVRRARRMIASVM